jgi:hypothetical protein
MDPLLARNPGEFLDLRCRAGQIPNGSILSAAAATVANAPSRSISATHVVGGRRSEDLSAFEVFVARLVDGYEIGASVRVGDGAFAVRGRSRTG